MSPLLRAAFEAALRDALGDPRIGVSEIRSVGGGCISHAARVVTTTAGDFFAKWNDSCPPDFFEREADGLRELGEARGPIVVPRVFVARPPSDGEPAFILMEYLTQERSSSEDDAALGLGLATIHRLSAPEYGFPVATYCGTTRQDNTWRESWVDFFARNRIGGILEAIAKRRGLPPARRRLYDRLMEKLPDLLSHPTQPSLNHGDLWSGNFLHTLRGPALVDPACSYADREMELGITTLFGGFASRFWDAYQETWPLPPGWRDRNGLYQLYHLLNHDCLFGGHYGAEADALARRYA